MRFPSLSMDIITALRPAGEAVCTRSRISLLKRRVRTERLIPRSETVPRETAALFFSSVAPLPRSELPRTPALWLERRRAPCITPASLSNRNPSLFYADAFIQSDSQLIRLSRGLNPPPPPPPRSNMGVKGLAHELNSCADLIAATPGFEPTTFRVPVM